MVAATLERSLYMFVVKTTVEQDRALIAEFNSLPNVNHFNGMTNNCADFTRRVLDIYYPHSVKPDYINDFFMASPKAAARTFTHYAQEHPELDLRVLHFSQVPGTIKRSSECRSGTEQLYHSKKLVIPLAVLAWQSVPMVTASYMITGRFNPEHQFEAHPSAEALGADDDLAAGGDAPHGYTVSVQQLEAEQRLADESIVGSKDEWKDYRDQFNEIVDQAIHDELIPNRGYLKHVFKRPGEAGKLSMDADGALCIIWTDSQPAGRVGLSASNIFAADSDAQIAYQVVLARVEAELDSPKHSRETMLEFKKYWAMTVELHAQGRALLARKMLALQRRLRLRLSRRARRRRGRRQRLLRGPGLVLGTWGMGLCRSLSARPARTSLKQAIHDDHCTRGKPRANLQEIGGGDVWECGGLPPLVTTCGEA